MKIWAFGPEGHDVMPLTINEKVRTDSRMESCIKAQFLKIRMWLSLLFVRIRKNCPLKTSTTVFFKASRVSSCENGKVMFFSGRQPDLSLLSHYLVLWFLPVAVVEADERGDLVLKRTKDLGKTFTIIHEDIFSFGYIGAFLFFSVMEDLVSSHKASSSSSHTY